MLETRAKLASEGKISPLCVFAEGTVSNGRSLMKFKKGAFVGDTPIKVMAMKYGDESNFSLSISNINIITCIVLTLCQPSITLEIHEMDQDFDPKYSFARRGIKQEGEHAWEHVASDVKSIMSIMTGYVNSNQGFEEGKICEVMQDSLTLGIEFGFRDKRTPKNPGFAANTERKEWRVTKDGELERIKK